jgi:hypothetical protein
MTRCDSDHALANDDHLVAPLKELPGGKLLTPGDVFLHRCLRRDRKSPCRRETCRFSRIEKGPPTLHRASSLVVFQEAVDPWDDHEGKIVPR